MKTVILATLLVAAALPHSQVEAKSAPQRLKLQYLVTIAGVETARIELNVERSAAGYGMSSRVRSRGLIDAMIGFHSDAKTTGVFSSGKVRPAAHRADNIWRGDKRFVRISYGTEGPVEVAVDPLPEDDDRDPVPEALRIGAIDALSAAYAASLGADVRRAEEGQRCSDTIAVFDGRRRYDILTRPVGPNKIEGPVFQGKAFQCELELHRIAGHSKSPWLPASDEETGRIWFAGLSENWPPVPVRFEIDILLGSAVINLQRAAAVGLDLKPEAVATAPDRPNEPARAAK